jgi:broad specificity phosphatase PhoE
MIDDIHARHLVGVPDVREVWLIRHADAYRGMGLLAEGTIDPPLSERGREQCERLAARLAPVAVHAVWCSDLLRARQTADAIAAGRELTFGVDPRLREVRTQWDEVREPQRPERPELGAYPFPEPEAEVAARMRDAVTGVVEGLAAVVAPTPRAAVVTHSATIAIYLCSLLGLTWGQFRLLPQFTSVSVVAVRADQVVVRSIADVTHLAD